MVHCCGAGEEGKKNKEDKPNPGQPGICVAYEKKRKRTIGDSQHPLRKRREKRREKIKTGKIKEQGENAPSLSLPTQGKGRKIFTRKGRRKEIDGLYSIPSPKKVKKKKEKSSRVTIVSPFPSLGRRFSKRKEGGQWEARSISPSIFTMGFREKRGGKGQFFKIAGTCLRGEGGEDVF